MAKKKLSPLVILGFIGGGLWLIDKWSTKFAEDSAVKLFSSFARGEITIPPGKRWRVWLKSGQQTEMNSAQLENAINAKAVKSYSELPATA